jgi:hypothetical protein
LAVGDFSPTDGPVVAGRAVGGGERRTGVAETAGSIGEGAGIGAATGITTAGLCIGGPLMAGASETDFSCTSGETRGKTFSGATFGVLPALEKTGAGCVLITGFRVSGSSCLAGMMGPEEPVEVREPAWAGAIERATIVDFAETGRFASWRA